MDLTRKRIAVFASGNGSNAEKIFEYFKENDKILVANLFCNKETAGVLEKAKAFNIPSVIFKKEDFYSSDRILNQLKSNAIDLVVLAGFMWLVPENLVQGFQNKIINIHPALLPKYGGKGMYGMNVHKAVNEAKETESGITIHFVNQYYDEGSIIAQFKCAIDIKDNPEDIAKKVQKLEHENYPKVIEQLVLNQV